jgi:hypothetical protein
VLCAVTIPPADLCSFGFVLLRSMWPHLYVICVCLVFLPVGDLLVNCFVMCVLSDIGLCEGPILCLEESYRVWCVQLSVI